VLGPPESLTEQSLSAARARSDADLATALRSALSEAGLVGSRVGIDDIRVGAAQPSGTAHWVDAAGLFLEIRAVKTAEEVERIARATAINDDAIRAAASAARAGGRWASVTRAWRTAWAQGDGTAGFWGSGAGRYAAQLFDPYADYELQAGDTIRFEGGGWYRGYWADGGRAAVIGHPTERQRRLAEAQRAGAEEVERRLGPGALPADVINCVHARIIEAGMAEFPVANVWGHGIGLTANELPSVRAAATTPLELGNVLCFETPYFELGWGAMQMEDTYVISDNGCARLTTADRELIVVEEVET